MHKLRNVANKLPKKLHNSYLREAKEIYNAENKKEAIKEYKR